MPSIQSDQGMVEKLMCKRHTEEKRMHIRKLFLMTNSTVTLELGSNTPKAILYPCRDKITANAVRDIDYMRNCRANADNRNCIKTHTPQIRMVFWFVFG